jgi:hypothetical protein
MTTPTPAGPDFHAQGNAPGSSERESDVIADMKAKADAYGLWPEVKDLYDCYRKNGDEPARAAWCAMYEWDL